MNCLHSKEIGEMINGFASFFLLKKAKCNINYLPLEIHILKKEVL